MGSKSHYKIKDWKQIKVPLYSDRNEIKTKEREIIELFDLNFGKDWRFFISLYYWDGICRHHLQYATPNSPKASLSFSTLVIRKRKFYWSKGMDILIGYLTKGYKKMKTEIISENKHRVYWIDDPKQYFVKRSKGEDLFSEQEPYISSAWWEKYKEDEQKEIMDYSYFREDYVDMCMGREPSRFSNNDNEEERKKHQDQDEISPVT